MVLINKRNIYMLALVVICLLMIVIVPTYAKFPSSYVTDDDIVGVSLDFDLTISNIEEYEEIVVPAGESLSFYVEVTNSTGAVAYYGIWYKIAEPDDLTNDISIGRLFGTESFTSGSIENNQLISTGIGIINNSSETIKVNIGVASSPNSTTDIEYLGGKNLITGEVEVFEEVQLTQFVQDLYNDGSSFTTVSKPSVSLNPNQGIMLDNNGEYRYYGADPNNYVSFNGELWRIISVSDVKSSLSDVTGEQRVKIIRADSLGNYSWDSNDENGGNDWTQSDLMTELNDLYYDKKTGTCYNGIGNASVSCNFSNIGLDDAAKSFIDSALWYINAIDDDLYYDYYADDFYTNERAGTETWTGQVGLIYPSDYAYATDLSLCSNMITLWGGSTDSCTVNNWLRYGDIDSGYKWQWTISANSYDDILVTVINTDGYLSTGTSAYGSPDAYVRPVVYLKSNIYVTGGMGNEEHPYSLALIDNH